MPFTARHWLFPLALVSLAWSSVPAWGESPQSPEAAQTTLLPLPPPPNDARANAIAIPHSSFVVAQPTMGATHGGENRPCGSIGATVWYSWTAPADQAMWVHTRASNFDTVLAVYVAGSPSPTYLDCNDDGYWPNAPATSEYAWNAVAGTTYLFQAGGYNGKSGLLVLRLTPTPAPF